MTTYRKITAFMAISSLSALILSGTSQAQSRYNSPQTNHLAPQHLRQVNVQPLPQRGYQPQPAYFGGPYSKKTSRSHSQPSRTGNPAYKNWKDQLQNRKKLAYQIPARPAPYGQQFQRWVDYEPEYTLYPGDQLDIVVPSAPELSRTLTVGPDGRVVMPNIQPIMAAGRSITHLQNRLSAELATVLRDPKIAVTPRAYGPQQIFVGGEVGAQGSYAMPGPIGALEALLLAGGLRPTAKTGSIAVLRRAPNGGMMMRVVDLKNGMRNIREYNDNIQLRRGDVVFVPRTSLAEIGVWASNFRAALPIDFNLSYQFGSNDGGTTVISP